MIGSFSVPAPRQLSSLVKWEVNPDFTRASGTLLAGRALQLGTVLGKLTASGKLVPLDKTASDGSEVVAGVSYGDVDAGAADVDQVLYGRRMMIVSASGLRWPAGITDADKAEALAELDALGIDVRAY